LCSTGVGTNGALAGWVPISIVARPPNPPAMVGGVMAQKPLLWLSPL